MLQILKLLKFSLAARQDKSTNFNIEIEQWSNILNSTALFFCKKLLFDKAFWDDHILALREQRAAMDEPDLIW